MFKQELFGYPPPTQSKQKIRIYFKNQHFLLFQSEGPIANTKTSNSSCSFTTERQQTGQEGDRECCTWQPPSQLQEAAACRGLPALTSAGDLRATQLRETRRDRALCQPGAELGYCITSLPPTHRCLLAGCLSSASKHSRASQTVTPYQPR